MPSEKDPKRHQMRGRKLLRTGKTRFAIKHDKFQLTTTVRLPDFICTFRFDSISCFYSCNAGTGGGPVTKKKLTDLEERALSLWRIEAVKGLQMGSHGLSVAASQAPDSVSPIMGDLSRSPSPDAAPAAVNTGTQRPPESATPNQQLLYSKYRRRRDRAPTREETH